ncbi:MAG: HupE/UreJ family protein [Methylococcaceae bacterium]|nr:HupE/UreJ family protein [Methylococcaceae bacterium]
MLNRIITVIFLLGYAQFSAAHVSGLSSADLIVKAQGVDAKITFALQDIEAFVPMDSDQDAKVTASEQEAAKTKIAEWVLQGVQLTLDGQVIQPSAAGMVNFDQQNNVNIEFQYPQTLSKQLQLQAVFLSTLPVEHKQFVTIKNEIGQNISEKMLSQSDSLLALTLPVAGTSTTVNTNSVETPTASTFSDFLLLGIKHILTGYDHLLFLFSLLIVTRSFWPAIKIITFFTIAHSITLGLAGLNIVNIPSSIVEPLITVTIIYVALENIVRGDNSKRRQWLTFFFGLVHGLGFAAVLREMGISSYETGIMLPLFSFNLGVEIGQITVAAIVLPIIWWLHNKPQIEPRLTPVCSVLASLMGGYWLIERTLLS